ncbi:MAG: DEAD/DEAH box helicase [Proteobacteria bacterium]|nr:DEAD/DEAH box helicase [Pseudomonadota bacterium]
MVEFKELGLKPEILRAIEERGYTTPTPIQEMAIPYVLMGRDVLGCAQTGTGKTAGFCLPMLEILSSGSAKARMPRSLILEPTRELAAQVAESFTKYGKYLNFTCALLTGGYGMDEQIKKLDRGVDVLIATPGRMLDLFERGNILLHDIKIFVIDEADRMLDMGFIPDIEKIAGLLPKIRQTLFFSATMPPEIRTLSSEFLMNPKEVSVSPPATTAEGVIQFILRVDARKKRDALRDLLRREQLKNAFIFCNRKKDISGLAEFLTRQGFSVVALHGDLPQNKRDEALEKFRTGMVPFMVCSDVAARGLDIKGVDAVFNFDVPFGAEDYVHRIGRTGRAGSEGKSYTFVTPDDDKLLQNIHTLIRKDIQEIRLEGLARPAEAPVQERPAPQARELRRGRSGYERPRDRAPRPPREQPPTGQTVGFGEDLPNFLTKSRISESQKEDTF